MSLEKLLNDDTLEKQIEDAQEKVQLLVLKFTLVEFLKKIKENTEITMEDFVATLEEVLENFDEE